MSLKKETKPSDCLVSYPGCVISHCGGGAYLSVEIQSVYSPAPRDWATVCVLMCVSVCVFASVHVRKKKQLIWCDVD